MNISLRKEIAERLLGWPLDEGGFAKCPGWQSHSNRSGRRDFQVVLEGAPTGRCFHQSCSAAVEEFNARLRSEIGKAEAREARGETPGRGPVMGPVAPRPEAVKVVKRPPYDPLKLGEFAARIPHGIDEAWLSTRSAVPIPAEQGPATAELLLGSLYAAGEKVLIFSREFSQGDFIWQRGMGCARLADRPGVDANPSPLPQGGPIGIWFLAAPVTGEWAPNPNNRDERGAARVGRRHGAVVTSWRFLVLESDEAPADLWLRAMVQLPLPIVAAYTSGGRSIHALVRVDASSKEEFDLLRDDLTPILCPLGADPAAMTAVRLTRLPGMLRHGTRAPDGKAAPYPAPRMQRLLYLNPAATTIPIIDLK